MDDEGAKSSSTLGDPFGPTEYQKAFCTEFAAAKAIIIHQADYSLARLRNSDFTDLS